MSLAVGATFGPYEITAPLGAGGMGEVYRARDPRLHRDVAIKVLPDLFAADRERLSRFEREAQALAALNHPNIAQIHGIEEASGTPGRPPVRGLVMEFVDGEDLAARIARGPLPVDDALAIARQVAEALEAAHEQGIVHRDLKPANIKVRADGTVKVLDFGLAKAMGGADTLVDAAALEHSPTFTSPARMTHAGVILGTAAYMAPEQARGKPVDRRADVWAFGAVLYEMLTGRRPFEGDTATDVLGAIVHKEPDWTALPAATPSAVRRLLRRCLEKDRRQRLRDIGDARLELDTARDAAEPVAAAPARGWRPLAAIVAVAAVAALAGVAAGRFSAPAATDAPGPQRFEIRLPDATTGVVSPDGSRVVFVSGGRLLVRDLDRLETRELAGTDGALKPFWSPDSATIAYGAAGKLYRVAAAGGTPSLICSLPNNEWDQDAGGAWRPDDTIVVTTGSSGLLRVAAVGGDPVSELAPDSQKELHFHDAAALPGGRGVLFIVHRIGETGGNPVDTIELHSGSGRRVLLRAEGQSLANPVYSPSGHVLFQRVPTNGGVWAVPFSLEQLEATGEPFLLIAGARGHSIGANRTMVYFPPVAREPVRLTWLDRRGEVVERIGEPGDLRGLPALSPDGARVAVQERTDAGWDLWLHHLARGTRTRLTTDGSVLVQAWLPDGRSLLYTSAVNSVRTNKRVAADGSGRTEDLGPGWGATATADGKTLFYRGGEKPDVMVRSMSGDAKPTLLLKAEEALGLIAASPDGRWIAHAAYQGAAPQIFVRPFPAGQGRWQVSRNGGMHPRWSGDGRLLFFAQDNDIFEVAVQREPELAFGEPRRLFTRRPLRGLTGALPFDVSADGQRFLVLEGEGEIIKDTSAIVVLNWSPDSEMRR